MNEKLKEKLNWLRLWMTLLVTINSACIAWFISNYKNENIFVTYLSMFAVILLTAFIILVNFEIITSINKIEEQK